MRIASSDGSLAATVLSFGATLAEVLVTGDDGVSTNVVVSLPHEDDFRRRELNPHLGAVAGRYANRIAGSRFSIDGTEWELTANEGENCLHGGPVGFSRRGWATVDHTAESVTLELVSVDGDQGFPGEVRATARYALVGSELRIELSAITDAPTVVNLTNHAYWNLAGGGDVHQQELRVAASRYLPTDAEQIPTGEMRSVEGTEFDLRAGRSIGSTPIDHCLVLDRPPSPAAGVAGVSGVSGMSGVSGVSGDASFAAELSDPITGRRLDLRTTEPGLQVYTGHKLRPPHQPFGGVALEAQRFPDAPNRPEFAGFGDVVLRPGERYRQLTTVAFG